MAALAAYTIIGLSLGGIFALAALGIVLIYRTTGVLNFAHGAMGMFSTFVAWQVFYGWQHPGWPGWLQTATAVAAGLVFADIVKTTIFLADMADFAAVNTAYGACFEGGPVPARSTVAVAALPRGSAVEIDVVALRR